MVFINIAQRDSQVKSNVVTAALAILLFSICLAVAWRVQTNTIDKVYNMTGANNIKKTVLFVCLGNTCRSPMAEAVFDHMVKQRGEDALWESDSAGLYPWLIGQRPNPKTEEILKKYKIPYDGLTRRIEDSDFVKFDYIFGMDEYNISKLKYKNRGIANSKATIMLLGEFNSKGDKIIEDPIFDDRLEDFETCYQQMEQSIKGFLDYHQSQK